MTKSVRIISTWGAAIVFVAGATVIGYASYMSMVVEPDALGALVPVFGSFYILGATVIAYYLCQWLSKPLLIKFPILVSSLQAKWAIIILSLSALLVGPLLGVGIISYGNSMNVKTEAAKLTELTAPEQWITKTIPANSGASAFQIRLPKHADYFSPFDSSSTIIGFQGGSLMVATYNHALGDPISFAKDVIKLPQTCSILPGNEFTRSIGTVHSLKIQCFADGSDNNYRTLGELLFERDGMTVEVAGPNPERHPEDAWVWPLIDSIQPLP